MDEKLFEAIEGLRADTDVLHISLRALFVMLVQNGTLPKADLIDALRHLEDGQRRQNAHADRVEGFRKLRQSIEGADPPDA